MDFFIEKYNRIQEGRFFWDNRFDKMFEQYYNALELVSAGQFNKSLRKLRYLLKKDSSFFPALEQIGWSFIEKGNYSKSKEYFQKAYDIATAKIPKDFDGTIIWGNIDNRYYLRVLDGLGRSFTYTNEHKKAIKIFEKLLSYNPNDNQGIRYLIGNLYLLTNNKDKAEKSFIETLDSAACRYSYGLLLLNTNRPIEAIQQFALSIIEDELIYKFLLDEEIDEPQDYDSSIKIQIAFDYFVLTMSKWFHGNAIHILHKVYQSEVFKTYYKDIQKFRKQISVIDNSDKNAFRNRSTLYNRIDEITTSIDRDFALIVFNEIKLK